jgi:hypothetical protein
MIDKYVNTFINNLPKEIIKNNRIDLVLDGGMFNGSYLVGAMYFLKEMEKRRYIQIERISGCSIGSLVAFLYYIDSLDLMATLYEEIHREFKKTHNLLFIKNLKKYIIERIPENICEKINGKLFICYNDIKKRKKKIKSNYKNIDEIIETIIKSCYVPLLVDNKLCYKHKYIDGINAHIFKPENNKKILHMELLGYDKITYSFNTKNEKTNFHRILSGLLDIHLFFIKRTSTPMCSYVNEWNLFQMVNYRIKILIEYIVVYFLSIFYYIKDFIPREMKNSSFIQLLSKIAFLLFTFFLDL